MNKNYGGVIWTNHALQRLTERKISQGDAWVTFRRPDQSRYAEAKGAFVYYKTYGNQKIEVVAKKNEKNEWLILSVWAKPVFGSDNLESKNDRSGGFFSFIKRLIFGKN